MKLQPGTEVTPNVRLESRIATGAMGSVWLAEHLTLNTKVAVKFISERLDPDDPEVLERFVREATTAAQIKSSHVVQTFDQGVMRDGTPYIVMEYLEGEGLGDRLTRDRTLPLNEILRIVQQTAKVLQSAHKLGIIHRDIKPDNIFLVTHDDELHVKLFDFGIAKHRREQHRGTLPPPGGPLSGGESQPEMGLTNDGVMIGTPEYMSPEQVMSASSVDHHADLWALAVVTYVCITGQLPFRGKDVGELCVNLLEAIFDPPSRHCVGLPPEMDLWFQRCLARDPSGRFQSARELAAAFAAAMPGAKPRKEESLNDSIDPRASTPSLDLITLTPPARGVAESGPTGPGQSAGDRGLRGATFSGTEADAVRARRFPMSTVGALVGVVLVVGIVGIAVFSGSDDPGPTPASHGDASAAPSPPTVETSLPVPGDNPVENPSPAPGEATLEHAASALPSTSAGLTKGPPKALPRPPWPRPKNPGF